MPSLKTRIRKLGYKGYLSENDVQRIITSLEITERYKEMCCTVRRIEEDNKKDTTEIVGFLYDESTKEFIFRKGDAEMRIADFELVTKYQEDNKENNLTDNHKEL